ncbi:ComEC/Rec2 family competence protein [Streptomyces sp. HUAS TT20]|uniref:ComEC/Rec2 family competence protein n=1 Tax=Streptomyces sp. HUAS TT20 TaxID=3447509 RepID=UPI0039870934
MSQVSGDRSSTGRVDVHAASGKRLGAAHPRQEGPTDLRLVPPALAAWATAALTLDTPPARIAALVAACLITACLLLASGRRGRPGGRRHTDDRAAPLPAPTRAWSAWVRPLSRTASAAVLLCVAAAAVSAGLHGADLRRGPVPVLARQYATVTAEVELGSDPWLSRPRVRGDHVAPLAVLIHAEVRSVEETDGTAVTTRTPVLMIVDGDVPPPESAARTASARPQGRSAWLGLLPTTRLRVSARLAPVMTSGDRTAAVLRVTARQVPEIVAGPSGPQRLAGRLRAGLREATDGLSADARALLPGLVVGDTSRITPELDEAFKETDLAHTLAVSGSNLTILLALLLGPPGLAQRVERRGIAPRLGISLRATALLAAALTTGFVVVCRPDPSVLRAAACGSVALLALATGRRRSLVPALATAILLLVLYDPWLARSYGFLLSVLATGSLLVLAPGWSAALRRRRVPGSWPRRWRRPPRRRPCARRWSPCCRRG